MRYPHLHQVTASASSKWLALALHVLCLVTLCACPVWAGVVQVPGVSLGTMSVPIVSLKERRFRGTVQQQYDFSCGSAALATLLTYHYDDKVSEADVFRLMYEKGDKEKIRREGFSLLDMKQYLEQRGYRADGFRLTLDKLQKLALPAIVLVNNKGFKHFVVIKGVTPRSVLLGDPALGGRVVPRGDFEPSWNGLVFLVRNKTDVATRHFNPSAEWSPKAAIALSAPLTNMLLMNPTLYLPALSRQ